MCHPHFTSGRPQALSPPALSPRLTEQQCSSHFRALCAGGSTTSGQDSGRAYRDPMWRPCNTTGPIPRKSPTKAPAPLLCHSLRQGAPRHSRPPALSIHLKARQSSSDFGHCARAGPQRTVVRQYRRAHRNLVGRTSLHYPTLSALY